MTGLKRVHENTRIQKNGNKRYHEKENYMRMFVTSFKNLSDL